MIAVEAALQPIVREMAEVSYVKSWVLSTVKRILNVHTCLFLVESTLTFKHGAAHDGSKNIVLGELTPSTFTSFNVVVEMVQ